MIFESFEHKNLCTNYPRVLKFEFRAPLHYTTHTSSCEHTTGSAHLVSKCLCSAFSAIAHLAQIWCLIKFLTSASDLLDSGRTLLATTTKMSERRERMEEFAKQMSAVVTYLRTGKHKPGFSRTQQKNTLNQCRTHFLRGKDYLH